MAIRLFFNNHVNLLYQERIEMIAPRSILVHEHQMGNYVDLLRKDGFVLHRQAIPDLHQEVFGEQLSRLEQEQDIFTVLIPELNNIECIRLNINSNIYTLTLGSW